MPKRDPRHLLSSGQFGTELVCIKTNKVLQACHKSFTETIDIHLKKEEVAPATKILCEGVAILAPEVCHENNHPLLDCCVDCLGHSVKTGSLIDLLLRFRIYPCGMVVNRKHKLMIPEEHREFFMTRAGEPGLKCQVEVFAECISCKIVETDCHERVTKIQCCIGVLIVAKLYSEVELLIPAYGYCPLPPTCKPIPLCPQYKPTAIPEPPPVVICPPEHEHRKHDCDHEHECMPKHEHKKHDCDYEHECMPKHEHKRHDCEPKDKYQPCNPEPHKDDELIWYENCVVEYCEDNYENHYENHYEDQKCYLDEYSDEFIFDDKIKYHEEFEKDKVYKDHKEHKEHKEDKKYDKQEKHNECKEHQGYQEKHNYSTDNDYLNDDGFYKDEDGYTMVICEPVTIKKAPDVPINKCDRDGCNKQKEKKYTYTPSEMPYPKR